MNHKEFLDERWLVSSSAQNAAQLQHGDEDEDEDEDEEALSLSDLPLIHQWRKENQNNDIHSNNNNNNEEDQEFDFCSFSKESEMCAADEIFFKGQILPLRHSVSSEKGLLRNYDDGGGGGGCQRRSFSRSDSMDHYYSSRSSSISSHQSSTSSGSGSGSGSGSFSGGAAGRYKPKLPPRIQFHSHPSPSPRLHIPSNRHGAAAVNHRNSISSKSSIWNVLRLGLVTPLPAEITFKDLKARSTNSGSRNSTSSSGGASEKKKKMRILGGGGCKCAADAVETAAPRVVIIKRSASESESDGGVLHDRSGEKLRKKQAAKKVLSQNRTFEWLKQLSVEGHGAADQ